MITVVAEVSSKLTVRQQSGPSITPHTFICSVSQVLIERVALNSGGHVFQGVNLHNVYENAWGYKEKACYMCVVSVCADDNMTSQSSNK